MTVKDPDVLELSLEFDSFVLSEAYGVGAGAATEDESTGRIRIAYVEEEDKEEAPDRIVQLEFERDTSASDVDDLAEEVDSRSIFLMTTLSGLAQVIAFLQDAHAELSKR